MTTRCAVCKTTVDLEWDAAVCEHDQAFCSACDVVDGCVSCRQERAA